MRRITGLIIITAIVLIITACSGLGTVTVTEIPAAEELASFVKGRGTASAVEGFHAI